MWASRWSPRVLAAAMPSPPSPSRVRRFTHVPVMLADTLAAWTSPAPPQSRDGPRFYVDCTTGGGGHSAALLQAHAFGSVRLLCLDRDPEALAAASTRLASLAPPGAVTFVHTSYAHLREALAAADFPPHVHGILADLGVSSHQIDAPYRGFSFQREGPLDMRFCGSDKGDDATKATVTGHGQRILSLPQRKDPAVPASRLVNELPESHLIEIFTRWGEEAPPVASAVARAIVAQRPLTTTTQLCSVIRGAAASTSYVAGALRASRVDREMAVVRRAFQGLRIAVNGELGGLRALLRDAPGACLASGGRLAILTFHSLEDRLVKQAFGGLVGKGGEAGAGGGGGKSDSGGGAYRYPPTAGHPRGAPVLLPSEAEVAGNPRSKPAKLRCIERTA